MYLLVALIHMYMYIMYQYMSITSLSPHAVVCSRVRWAWSCHKRSVMLSLQTNNRSWEFQLSVATLYWVMFFVCVWRFDITRQLTATDVMCSRLRQVLCWSHVTRFRSTVRSLFPSQKVALSRLCILSVALYHWITSCVDLGDKWTLPSAYEYILRDNA